MGNRIALWDNLKFFLVTCVVIGHFADRFTDASNIYDSIFLFIYSFHIPLFIFISGLMYKNKDITSKVIFFISIGFAYKIVSAVVERLLGTVKVEFFLLWDGGLSWFMFALAAYTIILRVIEGQNKRYILIFAIVLACFIGYDPGIGDFLYLSRIIIFFPFFLSGVLLQKVNIVDIKNKNSKYIFFAGLVVVIWLGLCVFELDIFYRLRYLFTGRNPFFPQIMSYAPLARLASYMISFVMCFALIMLIPNRRMFLITDMGKNSINVYFWHMHIYYILNKVFNISNVFNYGVSGKLVFLLIAVLLSIILSYNIFNFPIKQIREQIFLNRKAS